MGILSTSMLFRVLDRALILRTLFSLLLLTVLLGIVPHAHAAKVRGSSAIIIDASTGAVISQSNPDTQLFPASLTKMMTAYLLFEAIERGELSLSDRIRISDHATRQQPTKIGLKAGQTITIEDAIQAIVTRSANDIAVAVGERLGGSEQAFAVKMTNKARAIGMTRTSFRNASGLPNPGQVSTARDMSTLARRLILDFPRYYHYFGQSKAVVAGKTINGHNRLMARYPGMDGLKTGYIDASGFNLVSSASRGGVRLIGVVFGGSSAKSRDDYMAKLLDSGFASYGLLNAKPDAKGVVADNLMVVPPPPRTKPVLGAPPEVTMESLTDASATPQVPLAPLPASGVSNTPRPPAPAAPALKEAGMTVPPPPTPNSRGWAIQIGAYRDEAGAMVAATDLLQKLPNLISGGQPRVSLVESPVGKLYRSQIVGLEQATSQAACAELAKQRRNCLVLAPGQAS